MSANINTMIYVNEVPWHGLGVHYDTPPKTSSEIIEGAKLDWTVNTAKMYTDLHPSVGNYQAVYREDNNEVLGVITAARPRLVQNKDTFIAFDRLMDKEIDLETAASLGHGEKIFGCFKIREQYKLLDDDIDHYFVVMNDHLKADGKVTVMNTPVRVVCQNTLSAALAKNFYCLRIPVVSDTGANMEIANRVMGSVGEAIKDLQTKAEKMATTKIDRTYLEHVLDALFPYTGNLTADSVFSKANEAVNMARETFITDCMGAANLNNYKGTQYQVFSAITDYEQHYFKSVDKGYDLDFRMKLLPGLGVETSKVDKYLKIADKLIA